MQSRQRLQANPLYKLYVVVALVLLCAGLIYCALEGWRKPALKPVTKQEWASAYQKQDYDTAAIKLASYLEVHNNDVDARNILVSSYSQIGQSRNAYAQAQIVADKRPKSPDAWYRVAQLASDLRLYEEAIYYYKKALSLDSKPIQYHYGLANAYAKEKQYKIALEQWDLVLEGLPRKNPACAPVYIAMGDIYKNQGNLRRARQLYRKALRITPKDNILREKLAKLRRAS